MTSHGSRIANLGLTEKLLINGFTSAGANTAIVAGTGIVDFLKDDSTNGFSQATYTARTGAYSSNSTTEISNITGTATVSAGSSAYVLGQASRTASLTLDGDSTLGNGSYAGINIANSISGGSINIGASELNIDGLHQSLSNHS